MRAAWVALGASLALVGCAESVETGEEYDQRIARECGSEVAGDAVDRITPELERQIERCIDRRIERDADAGRLPED